MHTRYAGISGIIPLIASGFIFRQFGEYLHQEGFFMQIHRYIVDHQGVKTPISQAELVQLHISNSVLDAIFLDVYQRSIQSK